jgi:hypothetical protein
LVDNHPPRRNDILRRGRVRLFGYGDYSSRRLFGTWLGIFFIFPSYGNLVAYRKRKGGAAALSFAETVFSINITLM